MDARVKPERDEIYPKFRIHKRLVKWVSIIASILLFIIITLPPSCCLVRVPKSPRKPASSQCLLISSNIQQQATNTSDNNNNKQRTLVSQLDLRPFKPLGAGKQHQQNVTTFQQAELGKLINRSQHSVIIRYSQSQAAAQPPQITRRSNATSLDINIKTQQLSPQEPFESICHGWRTIISGQYKQTASNFAESQEPAPLLQWPYALWVFDRRRHALVAKFLFYERADLLEFSERLATLRSPIMPPIEKPAFISDCKLRFSSLMTISSHLEITLVESPSSLNPRGGATRHFIKTIMESKQSRSAQLASKMGEFAAWQEQLIFLGREPNVPTEVFKRPYVLEITAMPGMITSGSTERQSTGSSSQFYERPFLRGIALKNISFSDECFNFLPESSMNASNQTQLANSNDYSSQDEESSLASSPAESLSFSATSSGRSNDNLESEYYETSKHTMSILARVWAYKVQILASLGGAFLLVIVAAHLLYARQTIISNQMINQHYAMESNNGANHNSNTNNCGSLQPLGLSLCALACCATSRHGHHRIYPSSHNKNASSKLNKKRRASMGGVLRANKGRGPDRLQIVGSQDSLSGGSRGAVHACANWIDDIDLNDNPQYRSILMSQMKKLGSPLDVYSIDRKRITLTRLLGKGAFGQVYQGYLICFNSGDQLSEHGDRNQLQSSLESLAGPENEDLYTRLDRMERRQRRLEYANCSQSREQLDSHSKPVAVKILTENGLKKIDFLLEAHSMSILSYRNIVGFIGVSFEEEPRYLVMEFLAGGNLKEFLVKNRQYTAEQPTTISDIANDNNIENNDCDSAGSAAGGAPLQRASNSSLIISIGDPASAQHAHWSPANSPSFTENSFQMQQQSLALNIGDLLVIALDIARACDYLQKRKIIHRDLAARNCLLSSSSKRYPSRSQLLLTPIRNPSGADPAVAAASELQLPANLAGATNGGRLSATSAERHFSGSRFLSSFGQQQQQQQNNTFSFTRPFNMGRASAGGAAPSAADVDANHRVDLEQVYTNGFCDSGIVAKLADFGMTREIEEHSDYYRSTSREMPIRWMPPEALNGITTNKSDVWSFGILLWEIFSLGQLPYPDIYDNNTVYRMIRARAIAQKQPHTPTTLGVLANNTASPQQHRSRLTSGGSTASNAQHQRSPSVAAAAASAATEKQLLLGNTTASSDMDDASLSPDTVKEKQATNTDNNIASRSPRSPSLVSPSNIFGPPLGPPYAELPAPIYSIMCSCWANKPEERPQFEEIANRLYWCLQMPDVLRAPLPVFPPDLQSRSKQQQQHQQQKLHQDHWWAQ